MRFVSLKTDQGIRPALWIEDRCVVLAEYESLQAIIDGGEATLAAIKAKYNNYVKQDGTVFDLESLAAPIPRPRKNVFCVGLNYVAHATESLKAKGLEIKMPDHPVFFTKAPTCVNDPAGVLEIDPAVSEKIDWEAELGVVMGRGGKNIKREDAMHHVWGYTVINDVSARDLQSRHQQFFKGKSLDGYCPMGPCIVTADELDPTNLMLRLRVNGEIKQESTTGDLIFDIPTLIEVLSLGMTLEPGDIIATGTPSGVGFARTPQEFLQDGDMLETEIEGIGTLRNPVRRKP